MPETNDNLTFEVPIVEFFALMLRHLGKAHAIDKPLWEEKLKQYESAKLIDDRNELMQELARLLPEEKVVLIANVLGQMKVIVDAFDGSMADVPVKFVWEPLCDHTVYRPYTP